MNYLLKMRQSGQHSIRNRPDSDVLEACKYSVIHAGALDWPDSDEFQTEQTVGYHTDLVRLRQWRRSRAVEQLARSRPVDALLGVAEVPCSVVLPPEVDTAGVIRSGIIRFS